MLLERLLENLSVSIDAFATCRVAGGWRLRLPAVDWVTLHYVVAGEGWVRDPKGEAIKLPAHSLAVVPPHLVHSLQCGAPPYGDAEPRGEGSATLLAEHTAGPTEDSDESLLVACGRLDVTYGRGLKLFDQLHEVLVLDFSDDPNMAATYDSMLSEAGSGRPGSRAMTSTLMHQCLIRVFRAVCAQDDCSVSWLVALDDPSLGPVVEAMLESPEAPHTVASLASKAYMSRSAFARRFRESFGEPPLEYLRGIRLRHAAKLLRKSPPMPIRAVARRAGFSSRSQFSKAFRRYFGCSPSEFRA